MIRKVDFDPLPKMTLRKNTAAPIRMRRIFFKKNRFTWQFLQRMLINKQEK